MKKMAVVFWSGTGNTEAMAHLVAEGARAAGAEVDVFPASEFDSDQADAYEAFAFGCSAQGDEVLEEDEFEPMFASVESKLAGKPVVLFGSYGWGDGQWMRDWEERCQNGGISLAVESVLANDMPDDDAAAACKAAGAAVAQ